ncbi:hypothetical protein [Streptomyces sp. I05A-00742]|uniref:hypothetical protein n=1 Tax=Streptomyces sp. I05A-00742 TaxID=2732853 RepID=UPI0014892779|nr:hypothetical protein [Streptomyces sp. I05A-00742]
MAPPPPDFLLPHGPWGLLEAAHRWNGFSREAWHRMLRGLRVGPASAYLSRRALAMDFARWSASCLAHGLTAGGFRKEAATVFQAIGDYATPAPWQYITHHPERWREEFEATRSACLRRLNSPPDAGRRP